MYGKKYAQKNKLPYWILSAKYGLVKPDKMIEEYDKRLKNKKEASEIKEKSKGTLKILFERYDEVFLIGGDQYYRYVFEDFSGKKFKYIKSKNQALIVSYLQFFILPVQI